MVISLLSPGCSRSVEKPWGGELIFTEPGLPYVGKFIRVSAGCRLSLQMHDQKTETMTVLSGRALLVLEGPDGALNEIEMEPGRGYTIAPGLRHRLCAVSEAMILEVSTPEVGTTFRIDDDYGRRDEIR